MGCWNINEYIEHYSLMGSWTDRSPKKLRPFTRFSTSSERQNPTKAWLFIAAAFTRAGWCMFNQQTWAHFWGGLSDEHTNQHLEASSDLRFTSFNYSVIAIGNKSLGPKSNNVLQLPSLSWVTRTYFPFIANWAAAVLLQSQQLSKTALSFTTLQIYLERTLTWGHTTFSVCASCAAVGCGPSPAGSHPVYIRTLYL